MEISILLLVIGVLVGVYLIFKLIKKVVFIVISLVVFFLVVVGAIFGIVYLDFKNLTNQSDFDIQVIYQKGEEYEFGVQIPVIDKEISSQDIKKIETSSLDSLDVDEVEKDDNLFVVLVDSEFYSERMQGKVFSLTDLGSVEGMEDFTMEISGEDILEIFESNNPEELLIDKLIEQNSIAAFLIDVVKPEIAKQINLILDENGLGVKEMLFALSFAKLSEDEKEVLFLAEGFKSEDIMIYPDRIAFSLVKMLPLDTLVNNIPTKEVALEE